MPPVIVRVLHPYRLEVVIALVQHGCAFIVILVDRGGGLEPRALVDVNRDVALVLAAGPRDNLDAALGACIRCRTMGAGSVRA